MPTAGDAAPSLAVGPSSLAVPRFPHPFADPAEETLSHRTFRIAWTADFTNADGTPRFADVGLDVLAGQPHFEHAPIRQYLPALTPEQLDGAHGVVVLSPAVTAASLERCHDLLAVVRFGVGYDTVDVAACTRADVLAIITAGAVDRSMGEGATTWRRALEQPGRGDDAAGRT